MTPQQVGRAALFTGDCLAVLPTLPADSVDAIVTDPPYGLAFMGRDWDHGVPGVHFWAEALRVAKPGAHLVAFGGTRTYHRLACAIEDAGWTIRDGLCWLYGSGFPKSLDLGKAFDKRRGDDVRPVCRFLRAAMDRTGQTSAALAGRFGFNARMVDHWAARDTDSQPTLPTPAQWATLKDLLGLGDEMDAEVARLNARKGEPGDAWKRAEVLGVTEGPMRPGFSGSRYGDPDVRTLEDKRPETDLARAWDGWGTALKPAWEPIILARKPLTGTVAANVAAHGVGGLNIDACRIGAPFLSQGGSAGFDPAKGWNGNDMGPHDAKEVSGRWPANLILDAEAAALLDAQSGASSSPSTFAPRSGKDAGIYGAYAGQGYVMHGHGDTGGASRFFYTAKASRNDREDGLEDAPAVREADRDLDDGPGGDNPRNRVRNNPRANHHPTVKPSDLMRWLVRLVTPPDGLVLDPFMGSGSTGKAALLELVRFVGIDLDPAYVALAAARCRRAQEQGDLFGPDPDAAPSLFDA